MKSDLLKFKHNRKKDIFLICIDLKNAIEQSFNNQYFKLFFAIFEYFHHIPRAVLKRQAMIYMEGSYSYNKGSFSGRLDLLQIPKSLFECYAFFFLTFLKSKPHPKGETDLDLALDHIESNTELDRFANVLSFFEPTKVGIIEKNSSLSPHSYQKICGINYAGYDSILVIKTAFCQCLIVLPILTIISLFLRLNLIPLNLHFINQLMFYKTVIKQFRIKSMLQEKHYQPSSIKRFLLHSEMNGVVCTFQKNIFQLGRNGFYYDFDYFFSLGEKTFLDAAELGSNVGRVIPVGSVFMNRLLHTNVLKTSDPTQHEHFDVLFIGVNAFQGLEYLNAYDSFIDNYYLCFEWLSQISLELPHLNIGVKHHPSLRTVDPREAKILENTSIKRLNKDLNSYILGYHANCIVTFASTMAYEFLSIGKNTLMLDPNHQSAFYSRTDDYSKDLRCSTFEEFKIKIEQIFKLKKPIQLNKDLFCLNSEFTAEKIAYTLKNATPQHTFDHR